ncbi:MAG: hypothetical protein IKK10_05760 [Clostridia bacterium]|nr:hypothetical protein [Clostridia bacterium]
MKKDKVKKVSLILGVVFFLVILLLTYFSSTIDAMLIPNVKTTEVIRVESDSEHGVYGHEDRFLVPIKAVSGFGDSGTVFVINWINGEYYADEISVQIVNDDGMYYEVLSSGLHGGNRIIYSTSKALTSGDRVYVVEG